MNTFTPGPWKARFQQNDADINSAQLNVNDWYESEIYCPSKEETLALASYAMENDKHNFMLMAAAPELLECCKMWLEFMRMQNARESSAQMQITIKAIEKAEGK